LDDYLKELQTKEKNRGRKKWSRGAAPDGGSHGGRLTGGQSKDGLAGLKSVAEARGKNQPLNQHAEMALIHLRLSQARASLSGVGANPCYKDERTKI